jgi:hypothetical protein
LTVFRSFVLSFEKSFNLEFLATYPVRLIPVNLGFEEFAVRKSYHGSSFKLPPTPRSVYLSQSLYLADRTARGDELDVFGL